MFYKADVPHTADLLFHWRTSRLWMNHHQNLSVVKAIENLNIMCTLKKIFNMVTISAKTSPGLSGDSKGDMWLN